MKEPATSKNNLFFFKLEKSFRKKNQPLFTTKTFFQEKKPVLIKNDPKTFVKKAFYFNPFLKLCFSFLKKKPFKKNLWNKKPSKKNFRKKKKKKKLLQKKTGEKNHSLRKPLF